MADLPEIGQTSPSSSWVLRRPLLGTASICPFHISSSSWANRLIGSSKKSASLAVHQENDLEFGIYWVLGQNHAKSHWTHQIVRVIGRHWCGAWVLKNMPRPLILPQSPTAKNSPEFLWLWTDRIILLTLEIEPSHLINIFSIYQQPAILLRLLLVQPAQVLSVLSLCFSLPLFVATCNVWTFWKSPGWVGRRMLSIYMCI